METGRAEDVDAFMGPWASYHKQEATEVVLTSAQAEQQALHQAKKAKKEARQDVHADGEAAEETRVPDQTLDGEEGTETTEFHSSGPLKDYRGRSFVDVPITLSLTPAATFKPPQKCVHTWKGHSKGVSAIRFFPKSGHLLLSASMDTEVKLWSVEGKRQCLRTYRGHTAAVRDVNFSHDGRHFVTASYDKWVKYWDTETGQCIARRTTGKVPYCAVLHPEEKHASEVLVGQGDNRIVQWDLRDPNYTDPAQIYNEHLGAVNSILFIDHNRKFVSSADDKKMLVWEYNVPVVTAHTTEYSQHSMPYMALHPQGHSYIAQSQNNKIQVYGAIGKHTIVQKKVFQGHLSSGYAAQLGFSPDGKIVLSGDAQGRMFFWSWKNCKLFKRLKAHTQVTIGCAWHPLEPSTVASCSWDGTIKYWK
jgi:pre-mRNA-processing factor 17